MCVYCNLLHAYTQILTRLFVVGANSVAADSQYHGDNIAIVSQTLLIHRILSFNALPVYAHQHTYCVLPLAA